MSVKPFSLRKRIAEEVGRTVDRLLTLYRLVPDDYRGTVFYIWPRPDRMILIFDTLALRDPARVVSPKFVHHVSTALGGRRVVATNHRGVFLQIAYQPPALPPGRLERRLDLGEQPGPLHVPLGVAVKTGRAVWLPLPDMDAVLIGGTRRMGKTNLLHTWIQALLCGGRARLFLWDGKEGVEFGRYAPWAVVVENLGNALRPLFDEMARRKVLFREAGAASLPDYEKKTGDRLPRLVVVVDELAQVNEEDQEALARLVALGGAFGVHPVLATQRPDAKAVQALLKANLSTRIALPVPSHHDSMVVLGRPGAERLPKKKGRFFMVWEGRLVEFQAFPALPHEDFARLMAEKGRDGENPVSPRDGAGLLTPEETRLARAALERGGWFRIRELAEATGLSHRQVQKIARRWQAMGYLTPPRRDERGVPLGRRVTEVLRRMMEKHEIQEA